MSRPRIASYLERLAVSAALADPETVRVCGGDRLSVRSVVLSALAGIAEHLAGKDLRIAELEAAVTRQKAAGDPSRLGREQRSGSATVQLPVHEVAALDQSMSLVGELLDLLVDEARRALPVHGSQNTVLLVTGLLHEAGFKDSPHLAAVAIVRLAAVEAERRSVAEDVRHERTADAQSYREQNPPSTQEPE